MQNPDERSKNMMTSKFAFNTPQATHIYATRVPMINETVSEHILQRTKSLSDAERSAGSQYTDRDFPPNESQLWGSSSHKPKSCGKHWDGLQFKTPQQIFGSNYKVLQNISPTDIVQGSGGTCYFLCALSAMAERPQLIERLFEYNSRSVNSKGVYGIWLNINGMWELVILDDYLAVDRGNNVFFSACPKGEKEIWVSLLEKAYAKCFGSYNDTKGGDPVNAMRDLTGAPCKKLLDLARDSDKKWRQLVEGLNLNMPCTCYTKPGADTEEKDKTGIVLGHAYALLDAREVTDSRGRKDRIVKVRNPWGEWEWSGDWGDNSDRWTPELKRELDVQVRDDGMFWMPWDRMADYYDGICICKVNINFLYNAVYVNQSKQNNVSLIRVGIPKRGNYCISVNQIDSKLGKKTDPRYRLPYVRCILGLLVGDRFKWIDAKFKDERNITFESDRFEQGDYFVVVQPYWESNFTREFTVSVYGEKMADISILPDNPDMEYQVQMFLWRDFVTHNSGEMAITKNKNMKAKLTENMKNKEKFHWSEVNPFAVSIYSPNPPPRM
jgi:calpain-15